ncbi:hypothetical protein FJW08_22530 [Mesorhizobium sp. B3-2-1]|nr:hypothetical protein FJW08_22530 [Mesorhizobium sp. B3-2-1]
MVRAGADPNLPDRGFSVFPLSSFDAIPKGKRYALFPGKPLHTFPGIALVSRRRHSAGPPTGRRAGPRHRPSRGCGRFR